MFMFWVHFAKGLAVAIWRKYGIISKAAFRWPCHSARNPVKLSVWPSRQESARAQTNEQLLSGLPLKQCSLTRCIAWVKSLSGPAQRQNRSGAPPNAFTTRPESSASAGSPEAVRELCFQNRIFNKGLAGFFWFNQVEICRTDDLYVQRLQQVGYFAPLPELWLAITSRSLVKFSAHLQIRF